MLGKFTIQCWSYKRKVSSEKTTLFNLTNAHCIANSTMSATSVERFSSLSHFALAYLDRTAEPSENNIWKGIEFISMFISL